jgi:hypothetical protein
MKSILAFVMLVTVVIFAQNIPPLNVPPYPKLPDLSHTIANLSGKWKVTWSKVKSKPNTFILEDTPDGIKGRYISDNGAPDCVVSGSSNGTGDDGKAYLVVNCKNIRIQMTGHILSDNSEVQGLYVTTVKSTSTTGEFKMVKQGKSPCALPEGCD